MSGENIKTPTKNTKACINFFANCETTLAYIWGRKQSVDFLLPLNAQGMIAPIQSLLTRDQVLRVSLNIPLYLRRSPSCQRWLDTLFPYVWVYVVIWTNFINEIFCEVVFLPHATTLTNWKIIYKFSSSNCSCNCTNDFGGGIVIYSTSVFKQ